MIYSRSLFLDEKWYSLNFRSYLTFEMSENNYNVNRYKVIDHLNGILNDKLFEYKRRFTDMLESSE